MFLARQFNITLLILMAALVGCSSNPRAPVIDRAPTERPNSEATNPTPVTKPAKQTDWRPNTYIVQTSDTMYSIGQRFGLDYREIAALNGIPAPYSIKPGQTLSIPRKSATSPQVYQTGEEATTVPLGSDQPIVWQSNAPETDSTPIVNTPKVFREPYSDQAYNRESPTIVIEKSVNRSTDLPLGTTSQPTVQPLPERTVQTAPVQAITWAWPHSGKVISNFGSANKGLDIAGKVGQSVKAAAAGKVIYSGSDLRGYGRMVIIKHNDLFLSVYAHNSHIYVKEGQLVSIGQKIAELGSTASSRPKLHFEIRRQGKSINPRQYIPVR
jgi:lipoprotein NlpD